MVERPLQPEETTEAFFAVLRGEEPVGACPTCKGTCFAPAKCRSCDGSGRCDSCDCGDEHDCRRCNGTGKARNAEPEKCGDCDGKGQVGIRLHPADEWTVPAVLALPSRAEP